MDAADPERSYAEAAEKLDETERLLYSSAKAAFRPLKLKEELTPAFTKEEYCRMVEKARHYIHEGRYLPGRSLRIRSPRPQREVSLTLTGFCAPQTHPLICSTFPSDDVEIAGASRKRWQSAEPNAL